MKTSYEVTIVGQKYNIRTDVTKDKVDEIADYVNKKFVDVKDSLKNNSLQNAAILAALNIAEENFSLRKELLDFKQKVLEKSKSILQNLDEH